MLENWSLTKLCRSEKTSRYLEWRELLNELVSDLPETAAPEAYVASARELNLLGHEKDFMYSSDQMEMVHVAYTIIEVAWGGTTAVQCLLHETDVREDPRKWELVSAIDHSRYTVLQVEEVKRGEGVQTRDLLNLDERVFLTDLALSRSAVPGLVLATRVISCDGFHFSDGAALGMVLPESGRRLQKFRSVLKAAQRLVNKDSPRRQIAKHLIRGFGEMGADEFMVHIPVEYVESEFDDD
jgi:hypothetical protein